MKILNLIKDVYFRFGNTGNVLKAAPDFISSKDVILEKIFPFCNKEMYESKLS